MMKVLAVDDDVVTHMMLGMELDHVELIEAGRADDGFRLANSDDPDAVVIDLRLPDGDGLDLVRRMRHQVSTSQIPIVVLTASYDPANEAAALQAGADAYMGKPFEPREVEANLEALLLIHPSERRGRRRHAAAALRRHEPVASLTQPVAEAEVQVQVEAEAEVEVEAKVDVSEPVSPPAGAYWLRRFGRRDQG
jgi:DNA-binding response OmpR family regulator